MVIHKHADHKKQVYLNMAENLGTSRFSSNAYQNQNSNIHHLSNDFYNNFKDKKATDPIFAKPNVTPPPQYTTPTTKKDEALSPEYSAIENKKESFKDLYKKNTAYRTQQNTQSELQEFHDDFKKMLPFLAQSYLMTRNIYEWLWPNFYSLPKPAVQALMLVTSAIRIGLYTGMLALGAVFPPALLLIPALMLMEDFINDPLPQKPSKSRSLLTRDELKQQVAVAKNPVPQIMKRFSFSKEYDYLLDKHKLRVLNAFGKDNSELRAKIQSFEQLYGKNPAFAPYIGTNLGDFPNEITLILKNLSHSGRKELFQSIPSDFETLLRAQGLPAERIKVINNCTQTGDISKMDEKTLSLLFGLCDMQTFRGIKTKEFEKELENQSKGTAFGGFIKMAALNQYNNYEIHPPRGCIDEGHLKALFQSRGKELTPANCAKMLKNSTLSAQDKASLEKNDILTWRDVYSTNGLSTQLNNGKTVVKFKTNSQEEENKTFMHEVIHATFRANSLSKTNSVKNFFSSIYHGSLKGVYSSTLSKSSTSRISNKEFFISSMKKLQKKMEEVITQELETQFNGITNTLKDKTLPNKEKLEQMLNLMGVASNAPNFKEMKDVLFNMMYNEKFPLLDEQQRQFPNTLPKIENEFLRFIAAVNCCYNLETPAFKENADILSNSFQTFLMAKEHRKDLFDCVDEIYTRPKLGNYNFKNSRYEEMEESLVRLGSLSNKFENLKPILKPNGAFKLFKSIKGNIESMIGQMFLTKIPTTQRNDLNAGHTHSHTHSNLSDSYVKSTPDSFTRFSEGANRNASQSKDHQPVDQSVPIQQNKQQTIGQHYGA